MSKKKKEKSPTLAHPQKGKQDFDCNVYDYGFDDVDENEDFDLSSHARDKDAAHNEGSGEVIPKAGPRIKIPE